MWGCLSRDETVDALGARGDVQHIEELDTEAFAVELLSVRGCAADKLSETGALKEVRSCEGHAPAIVLDG